MSKAWGGTRAVKARAYWWPTVAAGLAICPRCSKTIDPSQPWDVGHVTDLALGGHIAGPTRPEHARRADCDGGGNRSAGGQLGAQLRRSRAARVRDWLSESIAEFFRPAMLWETPVTFVFSPGQKHPNRGNGAGPARRQLIHELR